MNQDNPGKIWRRGLLGVWILMAAMCIGMMGITWARYRTESSDFVQIQVRARDSLQLGTMSTDAEGDMSFVQTQELGWTVDEAGTARLSFTIANGSEADPASQDSTVYVRILASRGFSHGDSAAAIKLTTESGETYTGTAAVIEEGSALYQTFGSGWVITFGEGSKELQWQLEGGVFSYVTLCLEIEQADQLETSLLQLQLVTR